MELGRKRAPAVHRLDTDVVDRQGRHVRRSTESVVVPLQPGSRQHVVVCKVPHVEPADLVAHRAFDDRTESMRGDLGPEANRENGHSPTARSADEIHLGLHLVGIRVPVDGPVGTECQHHVDAAERWPFARILAHGTREVTSVLAESLPDEPRIGIAAVADDQSTHVLYGGRVLRIITDPFSRLSSAVVALVGAAGVTMLLSEVSPGLVLASIAVVASHTAVGTWVFDRLAGSRAGNIERLGIGTAVGSLLAMCWDQLFVATAWRDWSWIVFPAIAIVVVVAGARRATYGCIQRSGKAPTKDVPVTPHSALGAVSLLALTIFLLVQERYWPLPVALSLIPAAVVGERWSALRSRLGTGLAVLGASIAALIVLVTTTLTLRARPPLWWIKTQDFQFFEALSFSLAHWGSHDQVFVSGYPVYYHWFSYAWTGMLRRVVAAPEWVVLTRIAPVIVVLGIVLLVLELARRGGAGRWSVGVVIVFALLTDLNFESFSMVQSYVWLLAFVVLAMRFLDEGLRPVTWLAPFLAAGAFGAKSSNAPLIAAVVAAVVIVAWWRDRSTWWRPFVFALAHVIGLIIVFERLYWRSAYSDGIEIGTIGIARDFFGDISTLTPVRMAVASAIVLAHFVAVHFAATTLSLRMQAKRPDALVVVATGALVGSIPFLLLTWSEDYEQEEYFLHAMTAVTSILVGVVVVRWLSRQPRSRVWMYTLGVGGATWWWMVVPRTNDATYTAIFTRVIADSPTSWLLLGGAVLLVFMRRAGTERIVGAGTVLVVVLFLVTSVDLNQRWFLKYATFNAEIRAPNHAEFMLGRADVIDGALLVRNNTPEDAVIASNHFCERPLCALVDYGPHRVNWKRGGEAMTLTVYSQRRYWVNGYGFLWQNVEPPVEIRRRIADSLSSPQSDLEVDYFLRDRSMPAQNSKDAKILTTSKRFVLSSSSTN